MSEMEMKHFLCDYKNANNLGKLYFYPKFTKVFSKYLITPLYLTLTHPLKKDIGIFRSLFETSYPK